MTGPEAGKRLVIAIDGPAGAGKSTVARLVAARLGYVYVDTGAMYRAVTLKALREGVDPGDAEALARLVRDIDLVLESGTEGVRVRLDGEDVTAEIRRPEVSRAVSAVAAVPAVRDRMLELQRALARQGGVVMDGRDIGSRVLPWADRKIFITASLAERARRRQRELAEAGVHASLEEVQAEIARRDHLDTTRPHSPLVQVPDAIVIDTTGLTVDEVVTRVLDHCR